VKIAQIAPLMESVPPRLKLNGQGLHGDEARRAAETDGLLQVTNGSST
jgi:hypothetical protein